MSIASVGSSPNAFSTLEIAPSSTNTSTGTTTTTASTSDSASISTAAQQASNNSSGKLSQFASALYDARSKINAYEHQVTWQLEHKVAVTGPSAAGSNASTGTTNASTGTTNVSAGTTLAPASGELVHTQTTSALASAVSLQISGSTGVEQLSFAAGSKLSAVAAAVNNVTSTTGVQAIASGATLKFDSVGSGATDFVTVSAISGSFATTANSSAGAIAQTVADGIASIESTLQVPTGLTDSQTQYVNAQLKRLNSDQTQFQTFVGKRIERNYTDAAKDLSNKLNQFEHQITWQIDHGVPVTLPDGTTATANSSTGTTTTAANSSSGTTTTGTTNSSTGTTTTGDANSSTGTTTTTSNSSTGTTSTATSNSSTGTTAAANSSSGTTTGTSANTSTGTTTVSLADTIAAGITSLEAEAQKLLGPLSSNFATQFQQLQQSFATEQTRFAGFAARRTAYRAAHSSTGAAQDVTV